MTTVQWIAGIFQKKPATLCKEGATILLGVTKEDTPVIVSITDNEVTLQTVNGYPLPVDFLSQRFSPLTRHIIKHQAKNIIRVKIESLEQTLF